LVDLFIASSHAAAEDYLSEGLLPDRLSIIYEGVDMQEFDPHQNGRKKRDELGIDSTNLVVGSVARFSAGKGHLSLLESTASILRGREDLILLIVGDAPGSEGRVLSLLRSRSSELGVGERVVFTGWRDDIPDLLSAMDIYVQNSIEPEGLGIAAVEAAAMGRPMVVTDAGGLRETVVDGESGYVVSAGDIETLASRLNRLLGSVDLRRRMGKEAREHAKKNFDLGELMAEYEREFLGVLQKSEMPR
jgi:glycosyltransferase involved in cell wall biosynthesis